MSARLLARTLVSRFLTPKTWSHTLLAALGLVALASATTASAIPVIYTIGDSTVQTYTSGYYPRAGYGQVLQPFFDSTKVTIANKGVGGTSSKSYYDTQWAAVKALLKTGDYVFIGFGINDSATDVARHTVPFTTFKDYLTLFVNETKAKGAIPVLVATQPRNAWNATTPPTVYAAYHDYPVASRQLAATLAVPLIDLDQRVIAVLESVGQTYSTNFIYNNYAAGDWANYPSGNADNVHFQEMGAIELCKQVVAAIRALSGDANVSKLIPFLAPTYKVTFNTNNSAAGLVTRTEYFPAGVTVTAFVWPNSGYTFSSWSGSITGTKRATTFVMGTAAKTITANFSGGSSSTTYPAESGTLSGTGTVVETTNAGYNGTGYVNFPTTGGTLTFNSVNGGTGGTKTLRFRFALNGTAARAGQLVVNGVTTTISFSATGTWTTWATMDVAATLASGTANTIQLKSTGADLANVDELTVL